MNTTGKNNITTKFVAILMMGIIGMLVANEGIFMHTHKLVDGTVVFHSHPYSKSNDSNPSESHQHTKAEFWFFQNIEILFPLTFLAIAFFPLSKKAEVSFHIGLKHTPACIISYKGRAPPVTYN
jgi:hypothetical protein